MQNSKKVILMVDDDANIREFFQRAIANDEYEIMCAENGDDAQDILKKASKIDVAVIDLMMPHCTGWDLIEFIRKKSAFSKIPLIIFTGLYITQEMMEKVKQEAVAVIQKSNFNLAEFKETLKKVLDTSGK